jgi:hypothetical protein
MLRKFRSGLLLASFAVVLSSAVSADQESKSAPLAKQLAQALEAAKLDAIAAPDPSTGGFVAALYIPGTQLLVVSGKFATPDIGTYRISKKEFRELYMDLMGASIDGSRQFASDVSCDGFVFKPEDEAPADTWEAAGKTQAFAGHKKADLSEEDYLKAYTQADQQYAHILQLLIAKAKPGT